jgi:hypothetical protein
MGTRLIEAKYVNETSSNSRSRKPASRIKSVNRGTSVGQGPMYPLSGIETRVNALSTQSSSEERIIRADHLENDENRDPFNKDLKLGGINKTVEFEFYETMV